MSSMKTAGLNLQHNTKTAEEFERLCTQCCFGQSNATTPPTKTLTGHQGIASDEFSNKQKKEILNAHRLVIQHQTQQPKSAMQKFKAFRKRRSKKASKKIRLLSSEKAHMLMALVKKGAQIQPALARQISGTSKPQELSLALSAIRSLPTPSSQTFQHATFQTLSIRMIARHNHNILMAARLLKHHIILVQSLRALGEKSERLGSALETLQHQKDEACQNTTEHKRQIQELQRLNHAIDNSLRWHNLSNALRRKELSSKLPLTLMRTIVTIAKTRKSLQVQSKWRKLIFVITMQRAQVNRRRLLTNMHKTLQRQRHALVQQRRKVDLITMAHTAMGSTLPIVSVNGVEIPDYPLEQLCGSGCILATATQMKTRGNRLNLLLPRVHPDGLHSLIEFFIHGGTTILDTCIHNITCNKSIDQNELIFHINLCRSTAQRLNIHPEHDYFQYLMRVEIAAKEVSEHRNFWSMNIKLLTQNILDTSSEEKSHERPSILLDDTKMYFEALSHDGCHTIILHKFTNERTRHSQWYIGILSPNGQVTWADNDQNDFYQFTSKNGTLDRSKIIGRINSQKLLFPEHLGLELNFNDGILEPNVSPATYDLMTIFGDVKCEVQLCNRSSAAQGPNKLFFITHVKITPDTPSVFNTMPLATRSITITEFYNLMNQGLLKRGHIT